MTTQGRIYTRVSQGVYDYCRTLGREWHQRPGSMARTLILLGHRDGGTPKVVHDRFLVPLNISFTQEQKDLLVAGAAEISAELGVELDPASYARRCLHRGIEMVKAEYGDKSTVGCLPPPRLVSRGKKNRTSFDGPAFMKSFRHMTRVLGGAEATPGETRDK